MKVWQRVAVGVTSAILPVAAVAAGAVAAATHDAPVGGYAPVVGADAWQYAEIAASKPSNEPTWQSHAGGQCAPVAEGVVADVVLVVTQDGHVERMDFDAAWARSHDGKANWANDVWTIGAC